MRKPAVRQLALPSAPQQRPVLLRPTTQSLLAAGLTLLHFVGLAPFLVYPDFAADYPFAGSDTSDYLCDALVMAGVDLDYTGRPPLLPLVMAALASVGSLSLLPVLFLFVHHAFAWMVFAELVGTSRVAAWTGLAILLSGAAGLRWAMSLEPSLIGSYLLAASVLFLSGRWARHPLAPGLSGALAGIAYLLHQFAVIYPAVALLAAWLGRRRTAATALLVFLPFPISWLALRGVLFRSFGDLGVSHWGLVQWHTDAVIPYLVMGFALFGLPLVATSLFGLVRGFLARDLTMVLSAATATLALLFFVFFYDYVAQRFLLYSLPFLVFSAASALACIKNRTFAGALGALLVWVALLPRSAGDTQKSIPLVPGVRWQAEIQLTPRAPGPLEQMRLALGPPTILDPHSPYSRILKSRHGKPTTQLHLPRSETTADLYVLAAGELKAARSRVQVLLGRRVHPVPLAIVEGLVCSLELRRVGDLDKTTVWQATLPDGRSTTLSHRSDWQPLAGLDEDACEGVSGRFDATAAATLGASWSDRHVGILVEKIDPLLGLALFWTKGELIVVPPDLVPTTRQFLLSAGMREGDSSISIDGVSWRVVTYRGEHDPPPPGTFSR